MTALVVVEHTSSRERVKITRAALAYRGSGVGVLPKGRRVPIEGLLHGLLLVSGNDAAIALAGHVAGSEPRFVRMMNRRARALGLRCTRFVSSHGLERGNRSCPADLAALTRLAMDERRIARVVRKPTAAVRFPIRNGRLFVNSTNPLVRGGYPGALGLKTGYTEEAGRCLVGVARRGHRRLGVVLMHSPDPARQARKLLTTGFRRT
jgi:D-alanyl-D-alanine carboxypeptidase